ncbi:hypothetical protein DSO57_1012994 [Entomophthora muscae]|uniref:Uncharacterized protein n=1 Tax=Entomophthora muscae TaxID=34485 RepID=A0ACC2UF52_9FUNG|nr:hypothetical protein DSO57_1012994 [Entomophthora muscae]
MPRQCLVCKPEPYKNQRSKVPWYKNPSTKETIRLLPPLETNLLNRPRHYTVPLGAPFGPVHFTEYLPNPAYSEYNLETILIANQLARTRSIKYIGRKGKRIDIPPLLFKDKYNYLPAYFVPMTPPLTPRPDCPLEPTAAAETTSIQLFGVFYITLKGLVDSIVPNSGTWSLLRQYVSYIIKLAPILWWALPAGLAAPHPKPPNASTYDWLPDMQLYKIPLISCISTASGKKCIMMLLKF